MDEWIYGHAGWTGDTALWQTVDNKPCTKKFSVLDMGSSRCALGLKVKTFTAHNLSLLDQWEEAKSLWNGMIDLMQSDSENTAFKDSLSDIRMLSYSLILEWWDGTYQEPNLSKHARSFVNSAGRLPLSTLKPDASSYHAALFCLFHSEFHPAAIMTGTPRGLDANRSQALNHATAQRIAYSIYTGSHLEPPLYQQLAITSGQSVNNSCPWLARLEDSGADTEHLPYYLWDRIDKKIIIVEGYLRTSGIPEYTCISHTWGRWKKPTLPVEVDGVRDWKVPENTTFDVKALPSILSTANLLNRFVWLDLLCIPQDESNPRYLVEITRQGTIFRHSSACVAWMNDIRDWQGLRRTVEFLSIHYLHWSSSTHMYNTDELLSQATAAADVSSGLFKDDGTLSPWLTSLWTLQEACLCPEIILCNLDFEDFKVTLGQLLRLYNINLELIDDIKARSIEIPSLKNWPKSPRFVKYVNDFIGGDSGVHFRIQILALGQLRQCSGRRVEAIMSVLDVTDWLTTYLKHHQSQPVDGNLVLGTYPLSFVKEAARKIGSQFYGSLGTLKPGDFGKQEFGSLLPFSAPLTGSLKIDPWLYLQLVQRRGRTSCDCRMGNSRRRVSGDKEGRHSFIKCQAQGCLRRANFRSRARYSSELHSTISYESGSLVESSS